MRAKKKVSEYDQEIPQSQTTDKPEVSLGRAKQQSWDNRKTNKAKQSALSSSINLFCVFYNSRL